MGSAAPSVRRWLSVTLLLAAVLSFVALWPYAESPSDRIDLPALGSQPYGQTTAGRPPAATVGVGLSPGRTVPVSVEVYLSDDPSGDQDHQHGAGLAMLSAGAETVGGAVAVADGSRSFVVHGVGERHLAYRIEVDDLWSDWQTLSTGSHEAPDGLPGEEGASSRSRTVATPVVLPAAATTLEFVIIGGDTSSFDVTFIGSVSSDQPPNPAGAVIGDGTAALVASPSIIARDQWATFGWDYANESCDEGPSVADHLSAVVIHHTVTDNNYAEEDVVDLMRAIHYSHVVINGWCDIGYNFVVDRFGRVWEARTGSISEAVIGGHARGFNTSTVGVALLGQHHPGGRPTSADVSTVAESAVEAVAHWKLGIHGVDPGGMTWLRNRASDPPLRLAGDSWHYLPTVVGHRDLGVTSCPGGHGADLVNDLPAALVARRDVALPYTFANWQAHSHGPGFVTADGLGGVRPAGTASPWPQAPAGLSGGETAIAVGGNFDGGYLLTSAGSIVAYGAAPGASGAGPIAGAVDISVRSDGQSGWVLDGAGTLHGFGGTGNLAPSGGVTGPIAASVDDGGRGYVIDEGGVLHAVGGAAVTASETSAAPGVKAIDVAIDPQHDGEPRGWVLDQTGRLHGFGGAPSTRVTPLRAVVAVAAAGPGPGGWVLDTSGQLWPFGGARLVFPVSTNAAAGNVVDIANVGTIYRPEFVDGPDAAYVERIYELFLGRTATPLEADLQVTELEQGPGRLNLTATLATSEYWAGDTLDRMYADVLGRPPDDEGRTYWMQEIGSGLTLQDLGTYFYGSEEYAAASGSNESYVSGLYRILLEREPDSEGLAYWVGLLDSGEATPPDVAHSFYASIESRRDRSRALHQRIMGAAPSDEDAEEWAERLLAAGDVAVAAEMAASYDFYQQSTDGSSP